MPLNPWVLLAFVGVLFASNAATGTLLYMRGRDDTVAAYTKQELREANAKLSAKAVNDKKADDAGVKHEKDKEDIHVVTRTIRESVVVPPDRDPFVPVWFVRLLDRAAVRSATADPAPSQSAGDPSDVRLSEVGDVLTSQADDYYQCRKQVENIVSLEPVLPAPPEQKEGFFGRINPFR